MLIRGQLIILGLISSFLSNGLLRFVLLSQLSQSAFAEFLNFYPPGKFGEILHDTKLVGQLMRRDLILHDFPNFFQGYGLTRQGDDTGTDRFAQDGVGGGNDANLFDFRVVYEHAFKFMGIYFVSAAVDQVLGAALNF